MGLKFCFQDIGWRRSVVETGRNFRRGATFMPLSIAERRARAAARLMRQVHAIIVEGGIHPSSLHAIKKKLVKLAAQEELFPRADFPMPVSQGRTHPVLIEENDGLALYLTINLPDKMAAPHDHGIWCINAGLSGREQHNFYRRIDNGGTPGRAEVVKIGEVTVEPGIGMCMADHDIHENIVIGDEPAIALVLYGWALTRFPSVVWYHQEFGTVRASPSRRHAA